MYDQKNLNNNKNLSSIRHACQEGVDIWSYNSSSTNFPDVAAALLFCVHRDNILREYAFHTGRGRTYIIKRFA
nr:hypothetical protein Iba_chr05cCG15380 [Ipomoea batatas]